MQLGAHSAFDAVYREHHGFVWRALRHLGVEPSRLDDATQDTFLVVYRRLGEFEDWSALRTWLFQIARRVASHYRRTAAREAPRSCALPEVHVAAKAEDELARAEAAAILEGFLERLDPDKAVVFLMAELEQRRAPEIAEALGLNLNTVYARLRAARQQLDRVVHRLQARQERPRIRQAAQVIAAALVVSAPRSAQAWAGSPVLASQAAKTAGLAGAFGGSKAMVATITLLGALAVGSAARPWRPAATAPSAPPAAVREDLSAQADAPRPGAHDAADPVPAAGGDMAQTAEPRAGGPSSQRARRPTASPPPLLEQELAQLEHARAAMLAGQPRRALDLLAEHARRFSGSAFAEEVAATRVEALCKLGDVAGAQRAIAAFVKRWPASNLSHWVTGLCVGP